MLNQAINKWNGNDWRRASRRGSTTVLALMISMFLVVLVTATVALTMVEVSDIQDYSRNKKTFQAADSGVAHGKQQMTQALSAWHLSAATTPEDVTLYAEDAESGVRTGDRDISLLKDTATNLSLIMPARSRAAALVSPAQRST